MRSVRLDAVTSERQLQPRSVCSRKLLGYSCMLRLLMCACSFRNIGSRRDAGRLTHGRSSRRLGQPGAIYIFNARSSTSIEGAIWLVTANALS